MIIIPIKWLFHWEYTLFSDKPKWQGKKSRDCRAGDARLAWLARRPEDLDDSNSAAQGSYWKSWSSSQVLAAFCWVEGGCICRLKLLKCSKMLDGPRVLGVDFWPSIINHPKSTYIISDENNWIVLIQTGCFGGPKFGNLPVSITMWAWGSPILTQI